MMEGDSKTPLSDDDECQEAHEEGENEEEEDEISDSFLKKMGDKAHVLTNPLEIRQAWELVASGGGTWTHQSPIIYSPIHAFSIFSAITLTFVPPLAVSPRIFA